MSRLPCPSEHDEQKALMQWWKHTPWHRQGLLLYANPNGGARNAVTGARLKEEGVTPGIPDLTLAYPAKGYHGLYIEMKKQRGGRLSESQKDTLFRLQKAGYCVFVAKGMQEAMDCIKTYLAGVQKDKTEPEMPEIVNFLLHPEEYHRS